MMRVKAVVVSGLLCLSFEAMAEAYSVNVKRVDDDLYKTSDGLYIETEYCHRYTYGEEAILKYEQYSYSNKLIFNDDTVCRVSRVFK